jgi:uncharacterized membrane protein YjgN (DUF898 family)
MIYVKSILVVLPVCLLVIVVVGMVIYAAVHPTSGEGSIGWDPISLVRMNQMLWSIPVIVFFRGFMWEYRRIAKWH